MQTYSHQPFHDELREQAKLEGHHLPEVELASQASTMHSLGNLEDHHFSSLNDTPNKTSKVTKFGHHIKQEVQGQTSQIKSMLRRTVGKEVDTSRDNSPGAKKRMQLINDEIKQLPKREEQVVESEGHGDSKADNLEDSNEIFRQINEMRDRVHQYMSDLKQSQGEAEEMVVEGQGQAKEQESIGSNQKKHGENDLWEIAFHKIEEMKQRARQKGQEFKNQAQTISNKVSELHQMPSQDHHQHHHHLSAGSQSFQPNEHSKVLVETVREGLKDSSVPLVKKVEIFEDHWKHDHEEPERKHQESQQTLEKPQEEQNKNVPIESKQEKEKLSQEKQEITEDQVAQKEEKPGKEKLKEREPLLDKVFNRIHAVSDNIHNTVEDFKSIFKVEDRNQDNEGDTNEREPLLDKVFNRIHTVSDNIHHTVEDIRDALHVEDRNKDQNLEEKQKESPTIPEQKSLEEGYHIRERITERIHNVSEIISHKFETVKGRIASGVKNVKGRLGIRKSDNEGYHKVSSGFSKSVQQYTHETKSFKPYKSHNPFQALVDENEPDYESDEDVVKESLVKKIKERFYNGMNYLKSKLVFKRKGTVKKVKQEQEKEKQSLRKKVRQGLEALSMRISQNIESMKGRFRKDIPLLDQDVANLSSQEEKVEDLSSIKESAEEPLQTIAANLMKKAKSQKRLKKNKKIENRNNKTSKKQENWEDFHAISHGFSKSVAELERERRGRPAISSNPFDPLSAKALSQSSRKIKTKKNIPIQAKKTRVRSLPQKDVNDAQKPANQESFHEISHGFSESVAKFQKELRGAPLVSKNPFSSLVSQNVKKIQGKGKALVQKAKRTVEKAKGKIKSRISDENKENVVQNV